ncbi:pyridoxal 5'-phosphate synthase glutaminase subunit PdxT [Microbacterium sp. M28]|uniref:pyridoxal 5'-phosphate synthase glutaminase subunit PdxT n=1 Tax=Microbacterium sp. M28 TaxID=2962064 RepID=UPI0021F47CAF|nr:pyridoxal 5'-phosphate synthase glutaminase subunit PdxT [Microbacterium sp. M28]UYO98600.1 pyridoxal 5'-phosphate synthase glutaminase subunit PdxT [Microbacterium sp. M28]
MAGSPRVGVLALQGDVREHARVLEGLGAAVTLVRRPEELAEVDGLVLPGGESTVIDKLARAFGLAEPLRAAIAGGMPMYGTCAGLILLADAVLDAAADQQSFGGLDVVVRRNAFGRQTESFETRLDVDGFDAPVHATFIRAPLIETVGPRAKAIGRLPDGGVVAVEQGVLLGTSFHPEVAGEDRFHRRFLEHVRTR